MPIVDIMTKLLIDINLAVNQDDVDITFCNKQRRMPKRSERRIKSSILRSPGSGLKRSRRYVPSRDDSA